MADAALLEACIAAAVAAGREILRLKERGFEVEAKRDSSPVTVCDRAAEGVILDALARAAPGVAVIAEEECAAGRAPAPGDSYFLVDPLDGTADFARGGDEYSVNIGLIRDGVPVLGVIHRPSTGQSWAGAIGHGAFIDEGGARRAIAVREPTTPPLVAVSRSHYSAETDAYLESIGVGGQRLAMGSSLKFCLIAEGQADLYPRLSPTSEWDTAAGHALLLAAGGRVDGPDGGPLAYGKPDFLNPGFCASGGMDAPPVGRFLRDPGMARG